MLVTINSRIKAQMLIITRQIYIEEKINMMLLYSESRQCKREARVAITRGTIKRASQSVIGRFSRCIITEEHQLLISLLLL